MVAGWFPQQPFALLREEKVDLAELGVLDYPLPAG
jgi:hypothetical protein